MGFLWADGYISKRNRIQPNGRVRLEYNIKLTLKDTDYNHIQKFLNDLESNYPIHFYTSEGFNKTFANREARAFITSLYMGSFLYEELGLVPNRHDASKMITHIPKEFHKYFILGLFDADGSFSAYQNDGYGKKLNVAFGGSESLLRFIEQHLIENNIVETYKNGRELQKRHEGRDGTWLSLKFAGKVQGMKILDYLYDSSIYLDRKYQKYLDIPYHNN